MADQESAPIPEASADEGAPAGIKSKIPMIALVAVGLAVGAGSGAAFIGPMVAKKLGKVPAAHAGADSAAGKEDAGHPAEKGKEGEKAGSSADVSTIALDNLVLNPANSNGQRFLLYSLAIETGTAAAAAELKARDAELRDLIISMLGTKTVEELTDMTARDPIKKQVQTAIAERFGKSSVKRVYFTQFVVQ